jgi:hypothetical protein
MTRRALLRALLLAVSATMVLLSAWRLGLRQLVADVVKPRLDPASPRGNLSDPELDTIVAFAEVLVEGRTLAPEERRHLIEHVSDRTRTTPGYLSLYRTTARLLDRLTPAPFSTLAVPDREALMARHRLADSGVRWIEYLLPVGREALPVRVLAVPDLIAGYYRSPAGWAVVGYAAFPGRCGTLLRYTGPDEAA